MLSRGILVLITSVIISGLIFVSCDVTSENNRNIEETLEVLPKVTPITGASSATITVNNGTKSYFEIDFDDVIANQYIDNSKREAWCIAYNQPIGSGGAQYEGLQVSYAEGERWQPIRNLLSMKDSYLQENSEATYREVQVAIWALLDFPKFDIDAIKTDQIPSRMLTDGQFNFSKSIAKDLVELAKRGNQNQASKSLQSDTSAESDGVELCVVETDSETQTVIVPCKDTFWAWGEVSFRDGSNETFDDQGQWGWVYFFRSQDENPASTPLIAGAGQDDGTLTAEDLQDHWVGFLNVEVSGNKLTVEYEASGFNQFKEAHLWVGCDYTTDLPLSGSNVPPGQLPFSYEPSGDYFTSYTFEFTIASENDYDNNQIKACPDGIYQMAAHGVAHWGN